jgi:hypothetical protein
MSNDTPPFRRRPLLGSLRPEPPLFETGDYTIPDPLDARLTAPEEPLVATDYDDGESTTITRQRVR